MPRAQVQSLLQELKSHTWYIERKRFTPFYVCVLSHLWSFVSSVIFEALRLPRTVFLSRGTGSSVHGILQARILKRVSRPNSRGSPRPRDRTQVSRIVSKMLYRLSHHSWVTTFSHSKCNGLCFLLFGIKCCRVIEGHTSFNSIFDKTFPACVLIEFFLNLPD